MIGHRKANAFAGVVLGQATRDTGAYLVRQTRAWSMTGWGYQALI